MYIHIHIHNCMYIRRLIFVAKKITYQMLEIAIFRRRIYLHICVHSIWINYNSIIHLSEFRLQTIWGSYPHKNQ